MQKRSKKGFTLAELLIVVAIIAVLVAIAVPLFVSGLSKAQKAADDANVRSLRAAACTYLLTVEDDPSSDTDVYSKVFTKGTDGVLKLNDNVVVTATLSDGNFSNLKFKIDASATEGVTTTKASSTTTTTVTAKITQTDLSSATFETGE